MVAPLEFVVLPEPSCCASAFSAPPISPYDDAAIEFVEPLVPFDVEPSLPPGCCCDPSAWNSAPRKLCNATATELVDEASLADEVDVEAADELAALTELEAAVVLAVLDVAVVDDVLPIPSDDNAASRADSSGFESVELADEDDVEDDASSLLPPPERRAWPT